MLRPSLSSMAPTIDDSASSSSVRVSSSASPSRACSRVRRSFRNFEFKALPATETSEPRARALNAVIGGVVRGVMSMGNTSAARTAMTSRSACSAVPELAPGCRKAASRVGMVAWTALSPIVSCRTSNARAAAERTDADSSTRELRTMAIMSSS